MSDGYTPGYKPPYVGVNSGKTDNSPQTTDWTTLRHQYAGQFMAARIGAAVGSPTHRNGVSYSASAQVSIGEADALIAALKETGNG